MKTTFRILLPVLLVVGGFFIYSFATKAKVSAEGAGANASLGESDLPGEAFNKYWYGGEAELNSYELQQARYGEIHSGEAVLVFVAEDFSAEALTKYDGRNGTKVPVLKVNFDKKFITGIYPYSMLLSVATPVDRGKHPRTLKVSGSVQEWCGHTYTQLNLEGKKYAFEEHSYFPGEGDQARSLDAMLTEDELWVRLRLAPNKLPTGNVTLLPGVFYSRLKHVPMQPVQAKLSLDDLGDGFSMYTIAYADGHTLKIRFATTFPHVIEGWEERLRSGLTTTAKRKETIKLDYWSRNGNGDRKYREQLRLED